MHNDCKSGYALVEQNMIAIQLSAVIDVDIKILLDEVGRFYY